MVADKRASLSGARTLVGAHCTPFKRGYPPRQAGARYGQSEFLFLQKPPIRTLSAEDRRGATRDADPFGHLERGRPAGGARRPLRVRARQEGRARSHHLQQVEAHHAGRPPALALDRVDREVAAGDRRHGRHFRVADHRPRRRLDAGDAADRPRARPAPAAISTTAASRPAKAGTRSRFRRSTTSTSMRSKCRATRCSRPIATAP